MTAAIDRITADLLADNTQVVFGFEVLDPVIEEADAVPLAKLIQFVEPDRPWRSRSPKSLKKSSNPPGVCSSTRRAGSGPAFHMVWGTLRGVSTQQPGVALAISVFPLMRSCIAQPPPFLPSP
ncbi:MAG: hypothetical protein ABWX92_16865 [Mycetocola sp.]